MMMRALRPCPWGPSSSRGCARTVRSLGQGYLNTLKSGNHHPLARALPRDPDFSGVPHLQRLDLSSWIGATRQRRLQSNAIGSSPEMLLPRSLHSSTKRESFDRAPITLHTGGSSTQQQEPEKTSGYSWQLLVGMCAISVVICYADRSNISTAILPMSTTYGWDKAFQGVVLSSFFLGYALTQMLGGQLADRYGGKMVLGAGVAAWSLFTAVIPMSAAAGTATLLATRVMLGVGEGVAFPAIHSLIARNVPYANQSAAVGIVTAASYAGTALAFGVSPFIITHLGWPAIFYGFAALALFWLPFWLPLKVRPQQRTAAELLEASGSNNGVMPAAAPAAALPNSSSTPAPTLKGGPLVLDKGFWALLKRKEVWAICIAQYTGSWGMYGLLNWLPTFFSDFYHIELADLASYTLLPYIVQGGLGLASGFLADKLIASGWSVRQVRVGLQLVGMLGPAACLLLAVSPIVGGSPAVASSLITIGLGFSALTLGGVSTSHLDIAPKHAGAIFGAGNTAGTLAGFISVPVTGYLLQASGSWVVVFAVTALHYLVGAAFWAMWAGDRVLPEDQLLEEKA